MAIRLRALTTVIIMAVDTMVAGWPITVDGEGTAAAEAEAGASLAVTAAVVVVEEEVALNVMWFGH